jgi:hypothetical protein
MRRELRIDHEGSMEVGCPQRAAAKPSSVDYARYVSTPGNEPAVLERALRITTARA